MSIRDEEQEAAEALEATGNYRILRHIPKWQNADPPEGAKGIKIGLMVDVETTGLDPEKDEVIEFGAIMFNYDPAGRIYRLSEPYQSFNDPGRPILAEITALTGITDDMVKGQKIDIKEVDEMFGVANFVVAHKAAFDRKFCERLFPLAAEKKPWGCSMEQIPWKDEGFAGRSLQQIATGAGFFYDAHRSLDDCYAAIHMLSLALPKSGKIALTALRENAIKPLHRVWAQGSPFEVKDTLKARGYEWNDGSNGKPKSWYRDVTSPEAVEEERKYLAADIFKRAVQIRADQITIFDRFSVRE